MDVLGFLGQVPVLATTLAAGGLLLLADFAAGTDRAKNAAVRFLLDLLALPVGVLAILETALLWSALPLGAALLCVAVGIVLVGRSLREVPWTGALALVAAASAAYLVDQNVPGVSYVDILGVAAVVFVITYALVFLVEIPLRIAGLVAAPRPLLVAAAVGAFAGAGLVLLASGAALPGAP